MIAAYGNQRPDDDRSSNDGKPVWAEGPAADEARSPTARRRGGYQPRIYFGEKSPTYSIVGKRPAASDVELDLPAASRSERRVATTYDGKAGVPIGSMFNKLLYAMKFSEPNIVLSSRVNENSKILYDRDAARAGAEGRPVADRRLRPLPGRRRRRSSGSSTATRHRQLPDQPRRSRCEAMTADALQPEHDVRHAADRRDQLHAQLGQGRRRRVRRHGDPLRVGREGPDPQGVGGGVPRTS